MCGVYIILDIMLNNYINSQLCLTKNLDMIYENTVLHFRRELVDVKMYQLYGYLYNDKHNEIEARLEQHTFRESIYNRYKSCVVTGDPVITCEACHIEPYSNTKNNNTNNGLLLTASLHKLFDKYYFTIDANTLVCIFPDKVLKDPDYKNFVKYHNKKISDLSSETKSYLIGHNKRFHLLNGV